MPKAELLDSFSVPEAGELRPGDLALARALDAVAGCTTGISAAESDPGAVEAAFIALHEALGYDLSQKPRATIRSMSDQDNQFLPLTYRPTDRSYGPRAHVAGLTALIADAPPIDITIGDRAELIEAVVNGLGVKRYVGNNTHKSPAALHMDAAIDAARKELIAHKNAPADQVPKTVYFYEGLLRGVNNKTRFYFRLAAQTAGVMAAALLISKKI